MTKRFEGWSDAEVLEELDELGESLRPWEIDFVEDITELLSNEGTLTEDQRAKLIEIAEERVP